MRRRAVFWIPVVILSGLIIFLFCRVLIPSGSNGSGETSLFDQLFSFRCKADITFGEMQATADVVRSLDGSTRVTMQSPETLQGLQFDFAADKISLNFKGLKLDVEPSSFLASSAASALVNAFETSLNGDNVDITSKGGVATVTAKGDSGNFTLTLDESTGAPLSLSVPSLDLNCNFSEFEKNE